MVTAMGLASFPIAGGRWSEVGTVGILDVFGKNFFQVALGAHDIH